MTPKAENGGEMWAVIAAGSSGFGNYRHQADACHAYQVLRKSGVAEDHIILMMEDDVANDPSNPFPGQLFNKKGDGVPDVYNGCKVDYRGDVVTAALFLKVITGDATGLPAGSKVLKSGPNDRVFLNFVDHGGVGIVAFPNGPLLHASDLATALQTMKTKNMFGELLFYMEACESGSMFPEVTGDGKVFAVTASNAEESSWGYYCDPDDVVNGKHLGTCLGDLFSIAWMEDSDLGQIGTESIQEQVRRVTARTTLSHVSTFGDSSFESEPVGGFVAAAANVSSASAGVPAPATQKGAVNSRDAELQAAYVAWSRARTDAQREAAWRRLQQVVSDRSEDEAVFDAIVRGACKGGSLGCVYSIKEARLPLKDLECHKVLVHAVHGTCPRRGENTSGGWNGFNMQFSQLLVNICESRQHLGKDLQDLLDIVNGECNTAASRVRPVKVEERVVV